MAILDCPTYMTVSKDSGRTIIISSKEMSQDSKFVLGFPSVLLDVQGQKFACGILHLGTMHCVLGSDKIYEYTSLSGIFNVQIRRGGSFKAWTTKLGEVFKY